MTYDELQKLRSGSLEWWRAGTAFILSAVKKNNELFRNFQLRLENEHD